MYYVLLLLILVVCAGAYYEHTQLEIVQQDKILLEQKVDTLTAQSNELADQNKKLNATRDDLVSKLKEAQSKAVAPIIAVPVMEPVQNKVVPPPPAPKLPGNNLGTFTTIDARTFQNCVLLKVEADGITFNHSGGITKVMYPLLPVELQKRFGFDPHLGSLPPDQVELLESQRQAAGNP